MAGSGPFPHSRAIGASCYRTVTSTVSPERVCDGVAGVVGSSDGGAAVEGSAGELGGCSVVLGSGARVVVRSGTTVTRGARTAVGFGARAVWAGAGGTAGDEDAATGGVGSAGDEGSCAGVAVSTTTNPDTSTDPTAIVHSAMAMSAGTRRRGRITGST